MTIILALYAADQKAHEEAVSNGGVSDHVYPHLLLSTKRLLL
jgi:hypothetical protein